MALLQDLLDKESLDKLKSMASHHLPAHKTESAALTAARTTLSQMKTKQSDDSTLFMQAMEGVKPLSQDRLDRISDDINHKTKAKKADTAFKRAAAAGVDEEESQTLSDMRALLNPVAADAYLSYKHTTLQNQVFNKLKSGDMRWYNAVDLHGATIDEARDAVLSLIRTAKQNQETVIKIVHGKGDSALLKTCVNGWLRQIPDIIAFCSAPAKDGGNGAVLVLLKRHKEMSKK